MSNFVPSLQQQAVFDWIDTGSGSAFVEAVAGAGKTTTLIEACKRLKGNVMFLAFNKKIVVEIQERLSKLNLRNVEAATFHSVGFKAIRKVYGNVKVDGLAKQKRLIAEVGIPERFQSFVFAAVSQAKNRAMPEQQISNVALWYDIVEHFELAEMLENKDDRDVQDESAEQSVEAAIAVAQKTLRASINISPEIIDFDDMIYLPVIKGMRVWQYDWILPDEAQDTNEARRALARMALRPRGRSLWVGDRHQSIYGFTGADADAVERIISEFNCKCLPLTTTYRCPKTVVALARTIVSHIEAHETAPEGSVSTIAQDALLGQNLQATDAILCRKTAPLVELAFTLIRKNIACHVEGRDIGAGLLKLATRWKVKNVHAILDRLEAYKEKEMAKLVAKGRETQAEALADRVDTLVVLCQGCDTLDCIKNKITSLFQDTDGNAKTTLTLCTAHRSKGREWNRVFILGYNQYMPSKYARQEWQLQQEDNLKYVAVTRAKEDLVLVDVATQ